MSMSARVFRFVLSMMIVVAAVATVIAQAPPVAPATATDTAANVQQSLEEILEEPSSADTYRYDAQGRRDPFRSLVGPAPKIQEGARPPGVAGFLIDELKLSGVIRTKQGLTAMLAAPDNKSYLIRVGDKVLDGEIIRITPSSVVFRQEVNDPTRIERFREVVKDLTPAAERR